MTRGHKMELSGNMVLKMIGNTPLICIDDTFIKCEFLNPSGSVKDRYAKYAVERAESEGLLKPGYTIVEATSGNMGNALAMVAAAKGYKMIVVTSRGFSRERVAISQAYGAEVRLVGSFYLNAAVELTKALASQEGFFCPCQFENPWNVEENRTWLAEEILGQLPSGIIIDAIVQGVGTGGTLIGLGEAFRDRHNPDLKLFAVEPVESPTITTGRVGHHKIEGISDGFVPPIFERARKSVTQVIEIASLDALTCMKDLAKSRGLFVGPSSGANFLAVQEVRRRYPQLRHILTLFCDVGEKYLTDHF